MTKLEAQERFNWLGKQRNRNNCNADISISLHKRANGQKHDAIGLTFRNGCGEKFGSTIQVAVYKNRVMFRTAEDGICMQRNKAVQSNNIYARFSDVNGELKNFIGDYELKYDDFYELYYIEKED